MYTHVIFASCFTGPIKLPPSCPLLKWSKTLKAKSVVLPTVDLEVRTCTYVRQMTHYDQVSLCLTVKTTFMYVYVRTHQEWYGLLRG